MAGLNVSAVVVGGDDYETIRYPDEELRLRSSGAGAIEVAEYISTTREGPPVHSHAWTEIQYVIEGEADFFVNDIWTRGGSGTIQMLPAGAAHAFRVPEGAARILMITIGSPLAPFARDLAELTTAAR